ncbi:MAG: DUF881 domain-containing protein [Clostridiales bacterium]|nr:DUF881 domain-containing protein [bacterium 210917-SL.2.15]MCI5842173.1 DUF881 domain-containing protein [Clostridiales bacterium]MDY4037253.1 DUF881 domain-containing protein [Candidatus Pseudoscilispira sp.]
MKESKHIGKVSISVVCVILGILLALQFKSVRENNQVDGLNTTRVQTMQNLLDEAREQNDRLLEQVKEMRKEVQSYREAAAGSSEQSDQALLDEIAYLQLAAGMTDVVGPGIEVVLEDSTAANTSGDEADYLIHDSDILSVVNELRDAGAEALSLNGNRILATSEIRCSGSVVTINGRRTSAPFVIDAIGDTDTMFNALMMRNGVVDVLKQWSIQVSATEVDELLVPAYDGTIEYRYAQTATEDNVTDEETEAS